MNDSNNYGGTFSPYEDIDTPDNEDKGEIVNPIDNYSPDRDDLPKDGLSDDHDMLGEDEEYTLDDGYFSNTDISDITNIDSRKPPMNEAQMILDEKLNLVINGIRIIVDRLDTIEEMLHADDDQ
jgi:hypothetical protein